MLSLIEAIDHLAMENSVCFCSPGEGDGYCFENHHVFEDWRQKFRLKSI